VQHDESFGYLLPSKEEDTQVHIILSYRNIEPTRKEKNNVQALSKQFERYFNNIVSVEWDFRAQRGQKIATCRLHSRSGYYRAKAKSHDLGESVNMVFERFTKQRRRKKKIRKRRLRRLKRATQWSGLT
jgi:ribosome-associated translation inhibitor RaiA